MMTGRHGQRLIRQGLHATSGGQTTRDLPGMRDDGLTSLLLFKPPDVREESDPVTVNRQSLRIFQFRYVGQSRHR